MRLGACCNLLASSAPLLGIAEPVHPLQARLDAGENIALQPGQVVEIQSALKLRMPNQRIETIGAETAADFARIVHADGPQGTLIDAYGIPGVVLSKLILDGNRPGFQSPEGRLIGEPMISLGGEGAIGQAIRNCIVMEGRCSGGWGAIHVQEGGEGIVVENNIVFSAGADIRGNGRSPFEKPFGWGDGISTASQKTRITNNLIYDATDEGIMLQGAPGSVVKDNVIVSISREMLGGIALIDPFGYYEMDASKRTFDYRGILIENNLIDAKGGRIHAGFPMGGAPWNHRFSGTTLVGSRVAHNHITGGAAGYGFVVSGVDDFEIEGNSSDATHSGLGDGVPGTPPDPPAAFQFDPATIGSSRLQKEFAPMKNSLTSVLRASRSPKDSRNALGYRDQPYPDAETEAVVKMAFIEMLGREQSAKESGHWKRWLQETRSNSDSVRRSLMTSDEFVRQHGYVDPLDLGEWRSERLLQIILSNCKAIQEKGRDWPEARELHRSLLQDLYN